MQTPLLEETLRAAAPATQRAYVVTEVRPSHSNARALQLVHLPRVRDILMHMEEEGKSMKPPTPPLLRNTGSKEAREHEWPKRDSRLAFPPPREGR